MSRRELDRKRLLDRVLDRVLRQRDVAEELRVSERHVRRLMRRYREHGPPGLISQRRGKPSNRKIATEIKQRVINLVRERYHDFRPTLANEKLMEAHKIRLSGDVRQWMIEAKIWHGKTRRKAKPPRQQENAHRPVLHSQQELDLIFSIHYQRILSKNLSLQFKKVIYNVQVEGIGYALRKAKVTVCESLCGNVTLLRNGKILPYSTLRLGHFYENIEDAKTINARVDRTIVQQKRKPKWKPAPDHPWFHSRI